MKRRIFSGVAMVIIVATILGICLPRMVRAAKWLEWADSSEFADMDSLQEIVLYQDGEQLDAGSYDESCDIKKIYVTENNQTIYDYPNGYSISIPVGLTPDYELARYVCRYESEDVVIVASLETGTADSDTYYSNSFPKMYDTTYTEYQNIEFAEVSRNETTENGYQADVFRAEKTDMSEEFKAAYSYVFFRTSADSTTYYRFLIKYHNGYDYEVLENMLLDSFKVIEKEGTASNNSDYEYPVMPNYWNTETKEYYQYLCNTDTPQWGLYFYQNLAGLEREHYFEEKTGTRCDLVMSYISMPNLQFDAEFAQRAYEEDKVVITTLRYEDSTSLPYCYPFGIVAGKYDEQFKVLADQIREFGHPVIIRMENEFNASWSRGNAIWTMNDPDWYRDAWIHIYEIFRSRGVDNAIFMSNEQSSTLTYSGANWGHTINYLPPKEYIQIIGITAYDFGDEHYEGGSFSWMYEGVSRQNKEFFANWPWIIGEFGCTGPESGNDKVQWIEEMFESLQAFPNIKGAVWFDSTDAAADGSIQRDFRLTSPEEAGIALFNGIKEAKSKSQTGEWTFEH